jgi:N,N-dimethylformamidase
VQPGETIKFMVSSEQPRYRADIVRRSRRRHPRGPGFKEVLVEAPANREYAGKRQSSRSTRLRSFRITRRSA